MPDDYLNTVSQLERHLTGNHIGSILECKDVFTANQRILNCLLEQIDTKEGLLNIFDQLNSIRNAPALTAAIENVKKGSCIVCFVQYIFKEKVMVILNFKQPVCRDYFCPQHICVFVSTPKVVNYSSCQVKL